MLPFTQESFDLNVDKRNVLLWNKVTWLITPTFAMITLFVFHLEDTCCSWSSFPKAYQPPPLSQKHINARKCNLSLVQIIVDVYHLSGLDSIVL